MLNSPEQFLNAQRNKLNTFLGLSQKSFANVEKVVELNLNAIKSYMEDSTEAVKALTSVKDVQELVSVTTAVSQPIAEKAVAYGKDLYKLQSGVASETAKLVEEQIAEVNKSFVELFESATKNAPAGTEGAVALMKSAMTAANSAYDTVSKATKQAVEMAEANVSAATQATLKAADTAASAGRSRKAA